MRRFLAWCIVAAALVASRPATAALDPGAPAPDFSIDAAMAGTPFRYRLADALARGPVVLYFFASWCPACKVTSPTIDRFAAGHPEVTVLGIAAEDAEEARAFLASQPRSFAVVAETQAIDAAYKVRALPTTIVLDAQGKVAWSRQGIVLPFELGWHLP